MDHITMFGIATLGLTILGGAAMSSMQVTAAPATAAATIKTFQFQPKVIEVEARSTVIWTNEDGIEHTVTSGSPAAPAAAFQSGAFGRGQSFSATFDLPGEFAYFCSRHKSMRGMVKVLPAP